MANVPGRKTDVSDAEWIGQLLRFGLIRRNFVPLRAIFDLRQLTRTRRKLIQTRTSAELRVEKLLQTTNIKLSSVASEIFGVSGRLMLAALAEGKTNPETLANLSKGKLRKKQPELLRAFSGTFTPDDAKLLDIQLRFIDGIEARLEQLRVLIEEKVIPYEPILLRLDTAPGINRTLAIEILAETGGDMTPWSDAQRFASWCGVCPGNRESAGKRRPSRTREGRPAMKSILAQAATSAALVHGSYLASRYRGVRARRGNRHAVIVIAHELAISIYFMLQRREDYKGPALIDPTLARRNRQRTLIRDLEKLGFNVTCTET
jgi:transposase